MVVSGASHPTLAPAVALPKRVNRFPDERLAGLILGVEMMIRGRAHRPQRRGEPFGPLRIPVAPQLVANAVAGHEQAALDRPVVEPLPVLPVRITGGRVQPAENVAQFVAIPERWNAALAVHVRDPQDLVIRRARAFSSQQILIGVFDGEEIAEVIDVVVIGTDVVRPQQFKSAD